jgi:hypothetical protein
MTEIEVTYCDKCGEELEPSQVGLCDSCRPRSFAELSDKAKDKAREAYTSSNYLHSGWWDSIYEDFIRICTILGIDLTTRTVKLMSGKTREEPHIYFSGFCSQGDGASFEGRYTFAPTASVSIREYCGDQELHRIADHLTAMQTTQRLLGLESFTADIFSGGRKHTEIDDWGIDEIGEPDEERFSDLMHDLADWLYRHLEDEYEYLRSNEVIDEYLNDETFDEDGMRV